MKNPKLIWKIVNSLNGIPLILYLFTTLHWPLFYRFTLVHIIIMIAIIYGLKSWIEIKFDIRNLIKKNMMTKMINYIGGGFLLIGVLFKIMHWPFANISMLIGMMGVLVSYVLIFFIEESELTKSNPDILDDI